MTSTTLSSTNPTSSTLSSQEWLVAGSMRQDGRRISEISSGNGCNLARRNLGHTLRSWLTFTCRVLRPGGWVQMIECYFMCQSDNGSITDSHPLRRWSNNYIQSLGSIKDPRAPLRLQSLFTAAGFTEIEHRMIQMPLCGWPDGMQHRPSFYHTDCAA